MRRRRQAAITWAATAFGLVLALTVTLPVDTQAQTQLTCASFATDPGAGLVGNPAVKNVTAVDKVTADQSQTITADQYGSVKMSAHAGIPFCQVDLDYSTPGMTGVAAGYAPGESQLIKMRFTFPARADWKGRLIMTAGGGSQGSIPDQAINYQNLWYQFEWGAIGVATDSGHQSPVGPGGGRGRGGAAAPPAGAAAPGPGAGGPGAGAFIAGAAIFGAGDAFGVVQSTHTLDKGKIQDWAGGRANGLAVKLAKQLALAYYGSPVKYTYWQGFSGGGHMGWAVVTNYPEEFNGALIGAPAADWQQFRLSDSWGAVVRKKVAQQTTALTAAQTAAATAAAIKACDAADGVVDGIIGDPRTCTWSAKNNICGAAGAPAAPGCLLNTIQADGIDRAWAGPHNSKGVRIWDAYDRGINMSASTTTGGSTTQVMRWNHADMDFDGNNLYVDQESIDLAKAAGVDVSKAVTYEQEAKLTAQTTARLASGWDRDLTRARNSGIKIMVYAGTADGAITPRANIDRYYANAAFFGKGKPDFAGLSSWYRFYRVLGVGHQAQPWLGNLIDWVEAGKTPDKLLKPSGFPVACPFPQLAIFNGSGSTTDAANYTCGGNSESNPDALCAQVKTKFGFEDQAVVDTDENGIDPTVCRGR